MDAHVELVGQLDTLAGDAVALHQGQRLLRQRTEGLVDLGDGRGQGVIEGLRHIPLHVRDAGAEGAEHRRRFRDYDRANVEFLADVGDEQRAAAAVGHQRELAGVVAALDGDVAQRVAHVGTDGAVDANRRLRRFETHWLCQPDLYGPDRSVLVEFDRAAEEERRIDEPKRHRGVGHGRLASRPGRNTPVPGSRPRSAGRPASCRDCRSKRSSRRQHRSP